MKQSKSEQEHAPTREIDDYLVPRTRTHSGAVRKFPKSTSTPSVPASLHLRSLCLQALQLPRLRSDSACGGARCCTVRRKDTMSASASSPPAGEENKQEAAPVRHCKGVNDLDKVVLREVRGSSAEVRSRLPLPLSCVRPLGRVPAAGSRRRSVAPAMVLFEAGFLGCCSCRVI